MNEITCGRSGSFERSTASWLSQKCDSVVPYAGRLSDDMTVARKILHPSMPEASIRCDVSPWKLRHTPPPCARVVSVSEFAIFHAKLPWCGWEPSEVQTRVLLL